jgi:hypothetical protein
VRSGVVWSAVYVRIQGPRGTGTAVASDPCLARGNRAGAIKVSIAWFYYRKEILRFDA